MSCADVLSSPLPRRPVSEAGVTFVGIGRFQTRSVKHMRLYQS